MNQIFKMREKSKKSTKPIHEPNFLNWTKTGKIDKTPVFQLVSWTKKEKYDSRIGHTSFSFWDSDSRPAPGGSTSALLQSGTPPAGDHRDGGFPAAVLPFR